MRARFRYFECRLLTATGAALCLLAVALLTTPAAIAGTVSDDRPLLFSFAGADSSVGQLSGLLAIAGDESSGEIYAINAVGEERGPTGYGSGAGERDDERVVCKFNAEGKAQSFVAGGSAGKSCLDGKDTPGGAFGVEGFFGAGSGAADVAVDNSGGLGGPGEGEQGRLYVSEERGPVHAFGPDGAYLWTLPLRDGTETPIVEGACGIAVDREGHLWVGVGDREQILEFAATGSPPAQIRSIPVTNSTKEACRLAVDRSGKDLYVGLSSSLPSGFDKYVDGKYDSSSVPGYRADVTIDQSKEAGHVFDAGGARFAEREPCPLSHCFGTEISGSPFGADLIGNASGIAYSPTEDRVYVSDRVSNSIKVFGPVSSGTVPDVSCQTSEPVALHSITAHCTIEPLGLPNAYHFEWKEGAGTNWGAAESSPPQSIEPTDGSSHAVALTITKYLGKQIRSNTNFQVRLVGTNTETGLSAYSAPDSPTTPLPPLAEVQGCATSAITTEVAHVACMIDPQEEESDWRILAKPLADGTLAECEALVDGEFEIVGSDTIAPEEVGLVEVTADLSGLDPSQVYCLRATAANPGGGDGLDFSFETLSVPPGEAGAAFASPRGDTSARVNARVNPNGGDFEYRFEWSGDGSNWTPLPIRESSIHARQPIVVADELSGLKPGTTYHYRLGLFEQRSGPSAFAGRREDLQHADTGGSRSLRPARLRQRSHPGRTARRLSRLLPRNRAGQRTRQGQPGRQRKRCRNQRLHLLANFHRRGKSALVGRRRCSGCHQRHRSQLPGQAFGERLALDQLGSAGQRTGWRRRIRLPDERGDPRLRFIPLLGQVPDQALLAGARDRSALARRQAGHPQAL